jgi:hypothetical protein
MSEIVEPEKDAFGFPIKVKEPKKEKEESIPWGKITIGILISLAIFVHLFFCALAGYLCYKENQGDNITILIFKIMICVLFNYFFLLYKLVLVIRGKFL